MSTLWIDDLEGFEKALKIINKRLGIDPTDTESSATLEISHTKREVVIRATEYGVNNDNTEMSTLVWTFNTDVQSIDEVLQTLNDLLGIDDGTAI